MSRPPRKPTLWTLRKVSTRIRLDMPRRLNRTDTFRLLWIFCFRNHYSIYPSLDGMCRPDQSARTAQSDLVDTLRRYIDMSRSARKPTLWTLRKVSTRISISMTRRFPRTATSRLLWIFCFRYHYSITLSPCDGMCRHESACADCAG